MCSNRHAFRRPIKTHRVHRTAYIPVIYTKWKNYRINGKITVDIFLTFTGLFSEFSACLMNRQSFSTIYSIPFLNNIIILIILVGYLLWPSIVVFFFFSFLYAGIVQEEKNTLLLQLASWEWSAHILVTSKLQTNYYKYRDCWYVFKYKNWVFRAFCIFISFVLLTIMNHNLSDGMS